MDLPSELLIYSLLALYPFRCAAARADLLSIVQRHLSTVLVFFTSLISRHLVLAADVQREAKLVNGSLVRVGAALRAVHGNFAGQLTIHLAFGDLV